MKTLQKKFDMIIKQLSTGTWTRKVVHIAPELSSEMKTINTKLNAAKAVLITAKKAAKAARKSLAKAKAKRSGSEILARLVEAVKAADSAVCSQQLVVSKVQQEIVNLKNKQAEKGAKSYPQKLRATLARKAKARNKKSAQVLRAKEVLFTTRKEEVRKKGIEILNKQGKVVCKLRNQIIQIQSVSSVKGDLTKCSSSLSVEQLERMLSAAQTAYKTLSVSVKQTQALLDSEASNVDIVLNRLTNLVSAA